MASKAILGTPRGSSNTQESPTLLERSGPLGCCSIVLTHLIHLILLTRIGRFFLRFSSLIATSIVLSCHNLASKIKINLSFPCKVGPSDNELFARPNATLDSKPT